MTRGEAIKILSERYSSALFSERTALETLVPELKESEEEKARKWIYDYIRNCPNESFEFYGGIGKKAVLAWLEKQGEQKTKVKYVYPKFRKGDVIEPITPNGSYTPVRVRTITDGSYICRSDDDRAFLSLPLRKEDEYRLVE